MKIVMVAVLVSAMALASGVPSATLSQDEVDRLVDSEVLSCIHQEDFEDAEAALRRRGATDAMLAHGYFAAMDKTKDAPIGSLSAEKFQGAVHGFATVAPEGQLTNLLRIATAATNQHSVADAILAYHRRDPQSRELLEWCMGRACDDSRDLVKTTAWNCLRKTLKGGKASPAMRAMILEFARKGLRADPRSVFAADRILEENDIAYARSALRKEALRRVADIKSLPDNGVMRRYFDAKMKEEDVR